MNCKECKFYRTTEHLKGSGMCRLNPPVVHIVPVQSVAGQSLQPIALFPPVGGDDWCGKYSVKLADTPINSLSDFQSFKRGQE